MADPAPTPQDAATAARVASVLRDGEIDTGDILLFDRKCASMSCQGGAICAGAKLLGRTRWDHIGVVVRDPQTQRLFCLEAALSGVELRPLDERILRSQSREIGIRRVQVLRSRDFHERAWAFANLLLHAPYEDRVQRLFNAGVPAPQRVKRERLFHAIVREKTELQRIEQELRHRGKMPASERDALRGERERVYDRYSALVAALNHTERSWWENDVVPVARGKMFCSMLVALLYQHLDLLLPYPSANSYMPMHFSSQAEERFASDATRALPLQPNIALLQELSLRQQLEENARRLRLRQEQAISRAPQIGFEQDTIIRALKRHALFCELDDTQLAAIAQQFRRRELEPGQVLFHEGAPGKGFFVVEQGECDVLVDYESWWRAWNQQQHQYQQSQTQQQDKSSDLDLTQAKRGAISTLRRFKTLALPSLGAASNVRARPPHSLVGTNAPGMAFGDAALLDDKPRRMTVRASTASPHVVLWRLDRPTFLDFVHKHPRRVQSAEARAFLLQSLREHPLFAEISEADRAVAAAKCFPMHIRAGETLVRQGDAGDLFFILASGRCQLTRVESDSCSDQSSHAVMDRVLQRGAAFGEAALLYNARRGADIHALEDTMVWCMDRATFLSVTRSGSAALLRLFHSAGANASASNTFSSSGQCRCGCGSDRDECIQRAELHSLLQAPSSPNQDHSNDIDGKNTRAERLAMALLCADPEAPIHFSQFAHLHLALAGWTPQSPASQGLLQEATYRVLHATAPDRYVDADHDQGGRHALQLKDLGRVMRDWRGAKDGDGDVASDAQERQAFARLLGLASAAPTAQIGYDDLARAISRIEDEASPDHSREQGPHQAPAASTRAATAEQVAMTEFRAFLAMLRVDLQALQHAWQAADAAASRKHAHSKVDIKAKAHANQTALQHARSDLATGWRAALGTNPTAADWHAFLPIDEDTTHQHSTSQWLLLVGAMAAAAAVRTLTAPLERIKILRQVGALDIHRHRPRRLSTSIRMVVDMAKTSGIRSLYRGNAAHCLYGMAVPPVLASAMLLFDRGGRDHESGAGSKPMPLLAAASAVLAAHALLYPLDVARVRQTIRIDSHRPRGIGQVLRAIYHREGVRALYRGVGLSSIGLLASLGGSLAIATWLVPDRDRDQAQGYDDRRVGVSMLRLAVATLGVQTLCFPLDTARRRMQVSGMKHVQGASIPSGRLHTMRVLYRGFGAHCLRVAPATAFAWLAIAWQQQRDALTTSR